MAGGKQEPLTEERLREYLESIEGMLKELQERMDPLFDAVEKMQEKAAKGEGGILASLFQI